MRIVKVKTKPWLEHGSGGGAMLVGTEIVVYAYERGELSIEEAEKIKEFFKTLRT